jgi:hypothetical protein
MEIGRVTGDLPQEALGGGLGTMAVLIAHELARRGLQESNRGRPGDSQESAEWEYRGWR